MGSTFCATHVRLATRERLVEAVKAHLAESGHVFVREGGLERDARHVLVFEQDGWTVVADEDAELSDALGADWGEYLSRALETAAVGIEVFHSDTARMSLWERGLFRGSFSVPEEGEEGEDGVRRVSARFLAPLASAAGHTGALDAPIRADATFPEDALRVAAEAIGLTGWSAGARYLLADPPAGAAQLVFQRPAQEAPEPLEPAPAPAEESGEIALELHGPAEIDATVGFGLFEQMSLTVSLRSGPSQQGITFEIGGDALPLLGLTGMRGWNPDTRPNVGVARVLTAETTPRGESVQADFPEATLRVPRQPVADFGGGAAALRRFQEALQRESNARFHAGLVGVPARAGEGRLRVLARAGGASASTAVAVRVREAPRRPILPPRDESRVMEGRERRALESYAGREHAVASLAFDTTWEAAGERILSLASELANAVMDAADADRMRVSILSAGAHPVSRASLSAGASIGGKKWAATLAHLAREAVVTLSVGESYDAAPGVLVITHEPNGRTIFAEQMRAAVQGRGLRIVPITVSCSAPRPETGERLRALARAIDRAFMEGAAIPGCLGGVALAQGAPYDTSQGWLPWCELAGLFGVHEEADWMRTHARAPGWRVLVPRAAVARLGDRPPSVKCEETPMGLLLRAGAPDPFVLEGEPLEEIERYVMPAAGTQAEAMLRRAAPPQD